MPTSKHVLYLLLALCFCIPSLQAQEEVLKSAPESQVKTVEEAETIPLVSSDSSHSTLNLQVDPRFDGYLEEYLNQKKVMGYRLQLYSGNRRADAEQVRLSFITKYEKERPDLIYQQPNFKIRVGNYRDRLEATKYLMLYKIDFPSAFIVKDAIHFQEEQAKK